MSYGVQASVRKCSGRRNSAEMPLDWTDPITITASSY
jgi:hypothetical protein